MPAAWYNDIESGPWLRALVAQKVIMRGDVCTQSIEDIYPKNLMNYTRCHFFAGIGGWDLALNYAGWPEDLNVWTGSCPCQPFSSAGKGGGFADERHLWPMWLWLIEKCSPPVLLGEQVENSPEWLDLVFTDLEGLGYACGAIPFPACSVGAPHIRQRLYWVAYSPSFGFKGRTFGPFQSGGCGNQDVGVGNALQSGSFGHAWNALPRRLHESPYTASLLTGHWAGADWLLGRDGSYRPVRSGSFPLVDGVPARVGRMRGYGNAIVIQQAATFIRSFMEIMNA